MILCCFSIWLPLPISVLLSILMSDSHFRNPLFYSYSLSTLVQGRHKAMQFINRQLVRYAKVGGSFHIFLRLQGCSHLYGVAPTCVNGVGNVAMANR